MPLTPANLVTIVVVCLLAFRMYGRVRRNIGRQRVQRKRLIARIVIFAGVTCLLGFLSFIFPRVLIGLSAGLALGVILALVGLRLTRFEATPEGGFYTPNPYIGVAISILFVGRVVYRLSLLSNAAQHPPHAPPLMQSSLSFLVFALLAGYYMAYYAGVLMRSRTVSV